MRLYRIMANVRAGDAQPNAHPGQLGLVTVWVRSDSEEEALSCARTVMAARRYQSVAELTVYLEQTSTLPAADDSGQAGLRAGYLSMRQEAIGRGDGLFELWYPEEPTDASA